jgi:uncharacterized protein with HEPN domain
MPRKGQSDSEASANLGPTPEDRKRVEAVLRAARDARTIVGTSDADAIRGDMMRARAVVNCITEIGEAASKLTAGGRARVGAFPWRQIVGMRNTVVHVYWGIDMDEVVRTCRDDLPGFIAAMETALVQWESDTP